MGDPFRNSLGKLQRRELLDRYSQHTQHCAACSQVPRPQQAFMAAPVLPAPAQHLHSSLPDALLRVPCSLLSVQTCAASW